MTDLTIDRLVIEFGAAGWDDARAAAVAERAVRVLADRLAVLPAAAARLAAVGVPPVEIDPDRATDAEAADALAEAWFAAIARHPDLT